MARNRVHLSRAAAFTLATAGLSAQAWAVNLLVNPGFEAPPDTTTVNSNVAGWTLVNDAQRASFFNNTPGGVYSIWAKTFQDFGGGVQQTVQNISANANYNLSSFIYFENNYPSTGSTIRMRLTWLDTGGTQIGSPTDLNITPASSPPLGAWTPFNLNTTSPAGAAQVRVFLGWEFGADGQAVSVFFDDVVLDGPGIPPSTSEWIIDAGGNYNVAGNWASGSVPNSVGATVDFLGQITAPRTVYSDTPITAGVINFNNANTYVLAGAGSLTLQNSSGNGQLNVLNGSHKINLPLHLGGPATANVATGATLNIADPLILNGNTLTKSGAGTLLIEAPVRSTALSRLTVAAGNANVNFPIGTAATLTSAATGNTTVEVTSAAKVTFNADSALRNLDAVTAVAGDQEIDLAGSRIRSYPASLTTEELAIYNDIRAARNSASGRDGIYSSLDDAGTNLSVGVATLPDAFGTNSVLVRLTRTGDANLDGITNIGDFSVVAARFNTVGRWDDGDFNYDTSINIGDFSLLAANFNQSAGALPRGAAVPEPAGLGLLGLAALGVARRRRA